MDRLENIHGSFRHSMARERKRLKTHEGFAHIRAPVFAQHDQLPNPCDGADSSFCLLSSTSDSEHLDPTATACTIIFKLDILTKSRGIAHRIMIYSSQSHQ